MTESADVNLKELFDASIEEGKDKNATIMTLATDGGIDITKAVREYNRLAREAGLILSVKERNEKITEMLNEVDTDDLADSTKRREIIEQIAEDYDLSTASATAHVKKFCETADIELPSINRNTLEDLLSFVKEGLDAGKERAEIIEGLQVEMGYTANSANSAWSRATRELGISTGNSGARVALEDTVAFIRKNEDLPRSEAVELMVEELGYAKSTANSFYTYLNFAKEYAKQEAEAA